jgi:hypothetical protein
MENHLSKLQHIKIELKTSWESIWDPTKNKAF